MTILSTLKSDISGASVCCGIDAEKVSRFTSFLYQGQDDQHLLFSQDELRKSQCTADPAAALCASFTFKEALFKIIGPYNFSDCTFCPDFSRIEQSSYFIPEILMNEHSILRLHVMCQQIVNYEIVTTIHTWRKKCLIR